MRPLRATLGNRHADIRTYLEDHSAFSLEEIKAMSKALDEAAPPSKSMVR